MDTILRAIKADITSLQVDAIVNAANPGLIGEGGVNGAIHREAGPQLVKECELLGGCEPGGARLTTGYRLPAKYVIHAVGPIWEGGKNEEYKALASCYEQSVRLAQENGIASIAFPSIGTGINGYPVESASMLAVNTVGAAIRGNSSIKEVIFCCISDDELEAYKKSLSKWERNEEALEELFNPTEPQTEIPEFHEATKEELQKNIQSLWEMMKKYAELAEHPVKPEDNFLRWRQARYKAAIIARGAGLMDRDTFRQENWIHTDTIAWAMGGVAFATEPPKSD